MIRIGRIRVRFWRRVAPLALLLSFGLASGTAAAADTSAVCDSACVHAFDATLWVMSIFAAVTILGAAGMLRRDPTWTLGDALAEEADNQPPVLPNGKPVMLASSSRTIALFGMLVLMPAVLGIGYYIVWALFFGRVLDQLDNVMSFFLGAGTLFAPYAVNQFREMLTTIRQPTAAPAALPAAAASVPSVVINNSSPMPTSTPPQLAAPVAVPPVKAS